MVDPFHSRRRIVVGGAALAGAGLLAACRSAPQALSTAEGAVPAPALAAVAPPTAVEAATLLMDLERRSFDYFWQTTNPRNGLVPDRWPTPSFASVAAVGFGLSAYVIGVQRGWITRDQALQRTLATLRFFHEAPQGPEPRGVAGHKGFFYHFLDMRSGLRFGRTELSTVDTALFLAGALHAGAFFDGTDPGESEVRTLAEAIYARVDWPWAQNAAPAISHGWHPESGFIKWDWKGYNEAMLVYLLALGSPTFAVGPDAWAAWTSTYSRSWGSDFGHEHLRFPPLFGHQFTHAWVDFRGIQDDYMRSRGHDLDYFENSRRATLAQQAYAIANPLGWTGYGSQQWGITACDGPADMTRDFKGRPRRFISYAGRGMGEHDDGTIAPYGAGSSLPFTPEIVKSALARMHQLHGPHIYGKYGFFAFNQSFTFPDAKLRHGRVVPGFGWVDNDYLGIEVGPLLLMLANARDESVWQPMRRAAWLRRGLHRAGFRGGWLVQAG
ncbi:MAG TPA: glucoamylase family protein [Rubrivivax sp.]|nr:glucoamylase family protein [Rubrivivax sp.]